MRTDFQHLLIQQDGGVLTITMNRPEVLNAFNDSMLAELTEAVEAAAQDEAVRCVVLTGTGRAFGSGQDLRMVVICVLPLTMLASSRLLPGLALSPMEEVDIFYPVL